MIFPEFGWTGSFEMSSFHGLSGGKTWRAARILSASGVSNTTGFLISGISGRLRAPESFFFSSAAKQAVSRNTPIRAKLFRNMTPFSSGRRCGFGEATLAPNGWMMKRLGGEVKKAWELVVRELEYGTFPDCTSR